MAQRHPAVSRLKAGKKSHSVGYSSAEQDHKSLLVSSSSLSSPPVHKKVQRNVSSAAVVTIDNAAMSGSGHDTLRRGGHTRQQQTLAAIFPDTKEGRKALGALKSAASELRYQLEEILFEKLDFGDTKALDRFYSASVAVADVTDRSRQANLFYQLGLRESFDMRQNIVTYVDEELTHQSGRRVSAMPTDQIDVSSINMILHVLNQIFTFAA